MNEFTVALIMRGLDGLQARGQAIAHNIANARSAGFQPLRVRFEDALARAAKGGAAAVEAAPIRVQSTPDQTVRLDLEIAEGAATAGRYAALIEILNRQTQIHAAVLNAGR